MPIKDLDHLSASSVASILQCGLSWRLSHIDKLQLIRKVPVYFPFGTAVHKGLESHWKGHDADFKSAWTKLKNKNYVDYLGSSWLTYYRKGQMMTAMVIERTLGRFDPRQSRVEVTEDIDLGFAKLNRRIDVKLEVEKMPILVAGKIEQVTGRLRLDIKTAGQPYRKESIDRSQQLMTYEIPDPKNPEPRNHSAYLVVTKSVTPNVQLIGKRFSQDEVKGQVERIRWAATQVRRGVFVQNKGEHCHGCDFVKLCYEQPGWEGSYRVAPERKK